MRLMTVRDLASRGTWQADETPSRYHRNWLRPFAFRGCLANGCPLPFSSGRAVRARGAP